MGFGSAVSIGVLPKSYPHALRRLVSSRLPMSTPACDNVALFCDMACRHVQPLFVVVVLFIFHSTCTLCRVFFFIFW